MHDFKPAARAVLLLLLAAGAARGAAVELAIDPAATLHRVDPRIYGHFLEHIYHACNGGLWGEMIWNRSFEEAPGVGLWRIDDGSIAQLEESDDVRLVFGDPAWTDYEFTLQARKNGGGEGFLVLFRVRGPEDFYWVNLGGWGNRRHGLERGRKGEGRWGVIKDLGEGRIETGRWHRLRLRCEGRRFQFWIDDTRLMDFTDDAKAHERGAVGIGTWVTRAEYRAIKVTALDGAPLFEGLPPLSRDATPRHWRSYGSGKILLDDGRPKNGRFAARIAAESGETGLAQAPLCLRKGETYRGSLWTRGTAPGGLLLRVTAGDWVMTRALPAPAPEWREARFEFTAKADAGDAALQIAVPGQGDVCIDQVSLMPDAAAATGGFRPDLLEAIAGLRPPLIRWPGGCYAERYRWKDGIGPQAARGRFPVSIWDDIDTNSYGTDEFIAMCRKLGAEPLIVINAGRHDPGTPRADYIKEACEWIEYCNGPADSAWGKVRAANGHPEPYGVRLWEIDNETWSAGVEGYIAIVKEFAPAMRAADPSIVLLACGGAGTSNAAFGNWNEWLLAGCAECFEYLSIHHYEDPNAYATGPRAYESHFRELGRFIAASRNPKIKVFVSEWNAQSTDWRTGLYAAGLLNAFERAGDVVAIASPALWLRHVSATAWDNALINFDHCGWFPAPNYVVMKLWRDHAGPHLLAIEGDAEGLDAAATKTDDGSRVFFKAVNPGAEPLAVALTLRGAAPRSAEFQLMAPDGLSARNTLAAPSKIAPAPGRIETDGNVLRFTMPPRSAGALTVRL